VALLLSWMRCRGALALLRRKAAAARLGRGHHRSQLGNPLSVVKEPAGNPQSLGWGQAGHPNSLACVRLARKQRRQARQEQRVWAGLLKLRLSVTRK
jgi:hypothetical protein